MLPLTRRGWLILLLATPLAPLALPLLGKGAGAPPVSLGQELAFTPRDYSVPISLTLEEVNRVTLNAIRPAVVDSYFQTSPLLASLQRKGKG